MTPFRGELSDSALTDVARAVGALRLASPAAVEAVDGVRAVCAVEGLSRAGLAALGPDVRLILTPERARALGLATRDGGAVRLIPPSGADAATLTALADPARPDAPRLTNGVEAAADGDVAALALVKFAGLLPAAVTAPGTGDDRDRPCVAAESIAAYPRLAGRSLRPVSEARVPLRDAAEARVVVFRPADDGAEHMAVVVGRPDPGRPVLCRLHSACFTGDVLGSLRCDCGEQLRGALQRMDREGAGVLLYLAQEGRGIGLANKLRAYGLQDSGLDTVDANLHLGFRSDERQWHGAARMLEALGLGSVRLLTNNPDKVARLREHGVEVVERVPHAFVPNDHNRAYLRTKAVRSGHALFDVLDPPGARAV